MFDLSLVLAGNCSNAITNPVTLSNDISETQRAVQAKVNTMRAELGPLATWFETNANVDSALRVHTGSFVGAAA